jgi:GNAT superfamily N-acetyltransferase
MIFLEHIDDGNYYFNYCIGGTEIRNMVGFAIVRPLNKDAVRMDVIEVYPAHRRKGYAGKLITYIKKYFATRNYKYLFCKVCPCGRDNEMSHVELAEWYHLKQKFSIIFCRKTKNIFAKTWLNRYLLK